MSTNPEGEVTVVLTESVRGLTQTGIVEEVADRERRDALEGVRKARDVLGRYTIREMAEALYQDDNMVQALFGETGGNIRIRDVIMDGNRISRAQHEQIVRESRPDMSETEVQQTVHEARTKSEEELAEGKSPAPADPKAYMDNLSEQERQVVMDFLKAFGFRSG